MTPLSVGFVGLGDQGLHMATAVAQAGFPLHVWARRPGSLDTLTGVPHHRHETLKALAGAADVVALCVSTDEDVEQLLTGDLLDALRPGSVVVNHGTGTPRNAVRLAEMCAAAAVDFLDAPVSGGRQGAEARTLTTMVGGPASAAQRCDGVFGAFSEHVVHLGGPGTGQTAKLFNNALLMMNRANVADILAAAVRLGIDPVRLARVLALGSGASRALTLIPLNHKAIPDDLIHHLVSVEALDMRLFATAMTEAGIDVGDIAVRGLSGAASLPEVVRILNPRRRLPGHAG